MTQMPDPMTARNHETPMMVQFSVFLPNRVGKMLEMLDLFEDTPVKLEAISVVDSADFGVCRIMTNRSDLTRELLEKHQVAFSEKEIIVLELGKGQRLADVLGMLRAAEISVHYAYALISRPNNHPTVAVSTEDQVFACHALHRRGVRILAEEDFNGGAR